jgi:hypothetical protein
MKRLHILEAIVVFAAGIADELADGTLKSNAGSSTSFLARLLRFVGPALCAGDR